MMYVLSVVGCYIKILANKKKVSSLQPFQHCSRPALSEVALTVTLAPPCTMSHIFLKKMLQIKSFGQSCQT